MGHGRCLSCMTHICCKVCSGVVHFSVKTVFSPDMMPRFSLFADSTIIASKTLALGGAVFATDMHRCAGQDVTRAARAGE